MLVAEDGRERFAYCTTEEGWNGVPDLFDDLRAVASKLEVVVERLQPRTFSRCQCAITGGVDATVGGRVDEVDRDGDAGRIAVQPTVTGREAAADKVGRDGSDIFA